MAELRKSFIEHLQGRGEEISQQWRDYLNTKYSPEILFPLYRNVHSLAGSGATFGFTELGQRARNMEIVLRARKESPQPPPPEEVQQLEILLAAILEEIEQLGAQ